MITRRNQPRHAARIARAAALALHCERALTAAARSTSVATRKRVRRAARDFVRRHRGNVRYLAWVVQRVAANAALAIALLGLGAAAAHAGAPVFDRFVPDRLAGQAWSYRSSPTLGDLDGDGDLDLVSGSDGGGFQYFQNIGSATDPRYARRTGAANPFDGFTAVSYNSQPVLVDLDADGDLDLLAGSHEGGTFGAFQYLRNTGSATAPVFVAGVNPLAGQAVAASSAPTFGDLDGDGDLDLIAGDRAGVFHYFQNTGNASGAAFVERTGAANPLDNFGTASDYASPALGDVDGDGDLDVVAGSQDGIFEYFENTGTAAIPAFMHRAQYANPFTIENIGEHAKAALGDLDADGDLDLVSGSHSGYFTSFENQIGRFVESPEIDVPSLGFLPGPTAYGSLSPFYTADIDADGDLDLWGKDCAFRRNTGSANNPRFIAESSLPGVPVICASLTPAGDLDGDGDIDLSIDGSYYRNTGTASNPAFLGLLSPTMPPGTHPSFADLDGDGDLDAATITDINLGLDDPIRYFENTGGVASPAFIERFGSQNLVNPTGLIFSSSLDFGDIDSDGDFDVVLRPQGTFPPSDLNQSILENMGTRSAPVFFSRFGSSNPFFGVGAAIQFRGGALGDFDGDGDLDTFGLGFSLSPNTFHSHYLENGIVRPTPRYKMGPIAGPFTGKDVGSFSSSAAGDFDADGDLDFVVTDSFSSGIIHYLENTGSARHPRLVERSGAANPFSGLSAGFTPNPEVGDIDADGDLDLISGENYGNPVRFFENTGSAGNPQIVERINVANPFAAVVVPRGAPRFGDLDADGDLDLVMGNGTGTLQYYQNTGNARVPAYVQRTGAQNPLNGLSVAPASFLSTPALGDVDRDGDLDLLVGDEVQGQFHYFKNTGTAVLPAFIAVIGVDNPLDGKTVGLNSTPAFADLDADGELDLVSGERNGGFQAFLLPEPSTPLLLTAGLGLLRWLSKRRRR